MTTSTTTYASGVVYPSTLLVMLRGAGSQEIETVLEQHLQEERKRRGGTFLQGRRDCELLVVEEEDVASLTLGNLTARSKLADPTLVFIIPPSYVVSPSSLSSRSSIGENEVAITTKILRPRDYVFVSSTYSVGKSIGVATWQVFEDCAHLLKKLKSTQSEVRATLPPLFLFNDGIDLARPAVMKEKDDNTTKEIDPFRITYIRDRIPQVIRRCVETLQPTSEAKGKKEDASQSDDQEIIHKAAILAEKLAVAIERDLELRATFEDVPFLNEELKALLVPTWLTKFGSSWLSTPWQHGEIASQTILLACFNLQAPPEGIKHLLSYGGDQPLTSEDNRGTRTFLRQVASPHYHPPSWFPPPTLVQSSLIYGVSRETDTYRVDKLGSVNKFFESHIAPLLGHKKNVLNRESIPLILRQCLWGNAVDLCVFALDDIENDDGGDKKEEVLLPPNPLLSVKDSDCRLITEKHQLDRLVEYIDKRILLPVDPSSASSSTPLSDNNHHPNAKIVDIIMDNCGLEAASDLLLALALVKQGGPIKVRLHVKPVSYFVSDVCPWDIEILLEKLLAQEESGTSTPHEEEGEGRRDDKKEDAREEELRCRWFAEEFIKSLHQGSIQVVSDDFWIQYGDWKEMPGAVASKYFYSCQLLQEEGVKDKEGENGASADDSQLGGRRTIIPHSDLVIVKGDLNYSRLFADRHYGLDQRSSSSQQPEPQPPYYPTDAKEVLGRGFPTETVPLASLRTVKSELVVGAHPDLVESALASDSNRNIDVDWRTTGRCGQIIFLN